MEINGISEEIFEQYEEIRLTGLTNMFDMKRVLQIAEMRDFSELIEFADNKISNYSKILQSHSEWRHKK